MTFRQKYFNLSKMTDDEISILLNSIPSDDENTSDDEVYDMDDDFILPTNNVVDSEHNTGITDYLQGTMEHDITTALSDALVYSQPSETSAKLLQPSVSDQNNENIAANDNFPTFSRASRRNKRVRSPELEIEECGPNATPTQTFTGDIMQIRNDNKEFKTILWRKQSLQLHVNQIVFRGVTQLSASLKELHTPYDCLKYFFNDKLFLYLSEQSNLYARQTNVETKFTVDPIEMRKFIGILIFMSVYKYPNVRSYWGKHSFEAIRGTMTVNRFEEIRRYLHFNDNSKAVDRGQPNYDRLFKVRPLVNHFNERFGSVPMLPRLCVDEQMCATKMTGTTLRQYMPNKPHKWGFKLFSLCDSTGFSYAFEIYTGAGDNIIPEGAPNLGAASNVVVRLSKNIPNFINHVIYFDNFYTSLGLLIYLRSRGIYSLGTVRTNRVPNCKLSSDAALSGKKVKRGYSEEYVGNSYGVDISSVLWQDTKTVRLLSTYVGTKPFVSSNTILQSRKATRWDKKERQHYEIECPYIIKEYNKHMGGVDLMDGLLGRYHIRMKTRKWPNRIFFHLIDVAMVNAYILYHRIHQTKENIQLQLFRSEVAESLCKFETVVEKRSIGRPSISKQTLSPKVDKRAYLPTIDIRYDQVGHWCIFRDRSGKKQCKYPKCNSETQAFCVKCQLSLCNSQTKSCFYDFHNNAK